MPVAIAQRRKTRQISGMALLSYGKKLFSGFREKLFSGFRKKLFSSFMTMFCDVSFECRHGALSGKAVA
jgi:hypothetical protein